MNDRPTLVLVVAIAAWGLAGTAVHASEEPGEHPARPALRVATYNVHQWHSADGNGPHNLEAVRDVLRVVDADILALQETEGARLSSGGIDGVAWLARELDMHHVQAPDADADAYGIAVLARWPISKGQVQSLPMQETAPRHALHVTVAHQDVPVALVTAHLEIDNHPTIRDAQVDALLQGLADGQAVLLGDLNLPADKGRAAYARLAEELDDAWLAAGHAPGSGHTSPVPGATERIDHVWVRGWQVLDAGRFGSAAASDHHGVWADLVHGGAT